MRRRRRFSGDLKAKVALEVRSLRVQEDRGDAATIGMASRPGPSGEDLEA